ncbi:hypothetical protein NKH48_00885 [Mesorhizobium sp. M1233]|uniref:hypothetical protein n=1 Tax=Mesorhizobium sp. M1233 TaxID=2957072 RepID=UPI003336A4D7
MPLAFRRIGPRPCGASRRARNRSRAKRRLADEYDAAQERGEIRKHGEHRVSEAETLGFADVGLSPRDVHEARILRDAEEVEPRFERLNGVDIAALILAENVERRNLTAGQRAMARAMLTRDVKPGERTDLSVAEKSTVSPAYVSAARYVLRHDEALARSVLNGAVTLNAAYETAKDSADEYDAAQEWGEVRKSGERSFFKSEKVGFADAGLSAKGVHEARLSAELWTLGSPMARSPRGPH